MTWLMAQKLFPKQEYKPEPPPVDEFIEEPVVDEEDEFKKFIKTVVNGAIETVKATPILRRGAQKTIRKRGIECYSKALHLIGIPNSVGETDTTRYVSINKADIAALFGDTPEGIIAYEKNLAGLRQDPGNHPFTKWMGLSSEEHEENFVFHLLK
jgi:hypothetical protein